MSLDSTQLQALKTDIEAGGVGTTTALAFVVINPDGSVASGMYPRQIAAVYNDPADTTPADTVDVPYATKAQMLASVDGTEYLALTDAQRQLWSDMLVAAGDTGLRVDDTGIRGLVTDVWAVGPTRTALIALQTRAATPGEVLFGEGVVISEIDVQRAERA